MIDKRYKADGHGTEGLLLEEPTLFEQSTPGRRGSSFEGAELPVIDIDAKFGSLARQEAPDLPELAEVDVVRHFTRLSIQNYSKDLGFYPLGSCTMKHNPRIANRAASMDGFANTHPYQPADQVQGNLEICYELERMLAEISGMDAVTLWPAAGSHGELTGMLMIRAYHTAKGNPRKKVLIPDSAHGTNPATAAICHYAVESIKSGTDGLLDPSAVEAAMNEEVAAIMITNPNTLGIFEENFKKVADIVHNKGGLVYLDGANLNALMGIVKPGEIGTDVMHFNLHKTFGTPHGGGGPGAGPVGVVKELAPFLPTPHIIKNNSRSSLPLCKGETEGVDIDLPPPTPPYKGGVEYSISHNSETSIGRINTFFGNFAVLLRAYTYIKELGADGLKGVTEMAVLNANYVCARLKGTYNLPYDKPSLHECVFNDAIQNEFGVKTLDIAKRLMDYGFHPPTIYFPLIVHGSIMIEPTETEPKSVLDDFCDAMISIAKECRENPELVKGAPTHTFRRRIDEVRAAKEMCLRD